MDDDGRRYRSIRACLLVVVHLAGSAACDRTPVNPIEDGGAPQPGDAAGSDMPVTSSGAGTSLYGRNALAVLRPADPADRRLTLAALVVGLSSVEVIREVGPGRFEASAVPAPPVGAGVACRQRVPIDLTIADVDDDGVDDVVVMDTCGNWVAIGDSSGGFVGVLAERAMPAFPPFETIEQMTFDDGTRLIVAGYGDAANVVSRSPGQLAWTGPTVLSVPSPRLAVQVTRVFLPLSGLGSATPAPALLYQGKSRLHVYQRAEAGGLVLGPSLLQTALEAPYVAPFEGFDHLEALASTGCAPAAIGVGVFGTQAKGVPRRLEWLNLGADGFITREIDDALDAGTLSVVSAGDHAVVGVLGRDQGTDVFAAYRLESCDQWSRLLQEPTDFAWRAPPSPAFGAGTFVPRTDGARLLGVRRTTDDESYRFFHYDGYQLRVWELTVGAPSTVPTSVSQQEISLHEQRTDLAFVD